MAIQNTAVLTTPTTIYTCPGVPVTASEEHAVTCMIFCNAGALDTTLSLFAVPDGASYLQCQIIKNLTIPAGETVTLDTEKLILSSSDTVQAIAGGVGLITATVSTVRVS